MAQIVEVIRELNWENYGIVIGNPSAQESSPKHVYKMKMESKRVRNVVIFVHATDILSILLLLLLPPIFLTTPHDLPFK